jgi:hypothetical protein
VKDGGISVQTTFQINSAGDVLKDFRQLFRHAFAFCLLPGSIVGTPAGRNAC